MTFNTSVTHLDVTLWLYLNTELTPRPSFVLRRQPCLHGAQNDWQQGWHRRLIRLPVFALNSEVRIMQFVDTLTPGDRFQTAHWKPEGYCFPFGTLAFPPGCWMFTYRVDIYKFQAFWGKKNSLWSLMQSAIYNCLSRDLAITVIAVILTMHCLVCVQASPN